MREPCPVRCWCAALKRPSRFLVLALSVLASLLRADDLPALSLQAAPARPVAPLTLALDYDPSAPVVAHLPAALTTPGGRGAWAEPDFRARLEAAAQDVEQPPSGQFIRPDGRFTVKARTEERWPWAVRLECTFRVTF